MSPRAHLYSGVGDTRLCPASCKQAAGQGRPVRQRTSQNRLGRTASGAIRAPREQKPSWSRAQAGLFSPFFFFLRDHDFRSKSRGPAVFEKDFSFGFFLEEGEGGGGGGGDSFRSRKQGVVRTRTGTTPPPRHVTACMGSSTVVRSIAIVGLYCGIMKVWATSSRTRTARAGTGRETRRSSARAAETGRSSIAQRRSHYAPFKVACARAPLLYTCGTREGSNV